MSDDRLARVAPELRDLVAQLPPTDHMREGELATFRAVANAFFPAAPPALQDVAVRQLYSPGPRGAPDVRLLLYTPPGEAAAPRPAVLHVHGGGYVMGAPEMNDAMNRQIALEAGCVVASVDYRLAPETRFPGAAEDCYAVLKWLVANAAGLGIDGSRIAVAGESAGGGHAAALAIHARDRAGPALCFQLLDAPMLDDRTCLRAPLPHTGEFCWTPETNRFGWQALLGVAPGAPDVPATGLPGRTEDLTGLPPTFLCVGGLDLFLAECLAYAARLAACAVPIELHVIPGAFHGFQMATEAPQTRLNHRLRVAALRRAFAG